MRCQIKFDISLSDGYKRGMDANERAMSVAEFLAALPAPLSRDRAPRASDKELAARIRAECALAVQQGVLLGGTKISVRINHHASLTVEIVEWHGAVYDAAHVEHLLERALGKSAAWWNHPTTLAPELRSALVALERIANRHNYDRSQSEYDHFDVGYYLQVNARKVEAIAEQGIQAEANPAYADLVHRAQLAAATLDPKIVRRACGRSGIAGCGELALQRLIQLANAAAREAGLRQQAA